MRSTTLIAITRDLLEMADWLAQGGCQMVAMESIASYWKPLYNILESSGLDAMVVNARHMKAVPGRKTDVKDSEWIADINGKSGRNILDAIVSGTEIDSFKYDEMYEKKVNAHNLKATKEQILDNLKGFMSPLQRKMMKELLRHVDELDAHIPHLDDDIDSHMKPDEKQAVEAIEDVVGVGTISAQ